MADANIKINIETQSLDQLNAKLQTLQEQIKKVPVGSTEFKKLSGEIRKLDGAVEGANKKLKALDVGQLAGNFAKVGASVASASALFKQFGDQGADSNKQIQNALEATNTILGAAAIAEGIAAAGEVAFAIATEGATVAQTIFATAVGTSTGALKALRIALITTGIGALVVGLGLLIGYLIDSAEETDNLAKEQAKLNKEFERQIELIDETIRRRGNQTKVDEAQAKKDKKSLEEINNIIRKQLEFERDENIKKVQLANKRQDEELANFKGTEEDKQKIIDKYDKIRSQAIVARNNAETELQLNTIKIAEDVAARDADISKRKIDAELAYYKARQDLLKIDYKERLSTIDRNQKEEIRLAKESGKSATEIQFRIQEINLKYSAERVKFIQDEEAEKLRIVEKSAKEQLEIQKELAESAGDVDRVKQIQATIDNITLESNERIKTAQIEAKKRLDDLFKSGKILKEVYLQAVADLEKSTGEFGTTLNKTIGDTGTTIVSTAVDSVLKRYESELNAALIELGIAADKSEIAFLKSITGKPKADREKEEDDLAKNQIANRKLVAEQTIKSTNEEIKALEDLGKQTDAGEEEKRNKKILELRAKRSKAELDLAKATTEGIVSEEEKRVEAVQEFLRQLEKVKFAYDLISNSVQALANIIADQAALQDLAFEEEIQAVDERYQREFDLISEREKKFEDELSARDGKLTAEERKRRAFAKERADLEKQQQAEIADLENARANAAADAAIKAAEVNFALAVGQITISTAEAVAKSISISPATFGLPFSAFAVAQGAIQIAAANSAKQVAIAQANANRPGASGAKNIRVSKAEGGLITGPGNGISDSVPANLSNGEFVVNSNATQRFLPLLNQINQSGLQGGNAVNPASGDNQMVALLQDIRQQLSQPNRSYVVATDIEEIKNKQTYINRRSNVL